MDDIMKVIFDDLERDKQIRQIIENTYDGQLVEDYKKLLNDTSKNENHVQQFLEKHTPLIPTPHLLNHGLHLNLFISKLPIGQKYKTDIVYLTKSSDSWWIVLMELENPHKKIFKNSNKHGVFSADFIAACQQIANWRNYIDDHKENFLKTVDRLKYPLHFNKVYFKYVLIMGRNIEKDNSEIRRTALAQQEELWGNLRIITYDTILSYYKHNRRMQGSIVLSPYQEDKFKIKQLPNTAILTDAFSYLTPDDLYLSQSDIDIFRSNGYDIDQWLKGQNLSINGKYTMDNGHR